MLAAGTIPETGHVGSRVLISPDRALVVPSACRSPARRFCILFILVSASRCSVFHARVRKGLTMERKRKARTWFPMDIAAPRRQGGGRRFHRDRLVAGREPRLTRHGIENDLGTDEYKYYIGL